MIETVNHLLAAALLAAALGLLAGDAPAAPRVQDELINRPANPFLCLTWQGFDQERYDPWHARGLGRCGVFDVD